MAEGTFGAFAMPLTTTDRCPSQCAQRNAYVDGCVQTIEGQLGKLRLHEIRRTLVVQDCCKHWDQFYAMDLLGRLKKSGEYAQIIQEATESTPPTGQSE